MTSDSLKELGDRIQEFHTFCEETAVFSYERKSLLEEIDSDIGGIMKKINNKTKELKERRKVSLIEKELAGFLRDELDKVIHTFKYIDIPNGDIVVKTLSYHNDLAPDGEELRVGRYIAGDESEEDCDYEGYGFEISLECQGWIFFSVRIEVEYDICGTEEERSLYLYKSADEVTEINKLSCTLGYKHSKIWLLSQQARAIGDKIRNSSMEEKERKECETEYRRLHGEMDSYESYKYIDSKNEARVMELFGLTKFIIKAVCDKYPERYEYEEEKFANLFSKDGAYYLSFVYIP